MVIFCVILPSENTKHKKRKHLGCIDSPFSIFGLAVEVVRSNRTALGELVVLPLLRAASAPRGGGRGRGRRRRRVRRAPPSSLPRLLLVFCYLVGAHAVLGDFGGPAPSASRRSPASAPAVSIATSANVSQTWL